MIAGAGKPDSGITRQLRRNRAGSSGSHPSRQAGSRPCGIRRRRGGVHLREAAAGAGRAAGGVTGARGRCARSRARSTRPPRPGTRSRRWAGPHRRRPDRGPGWPARLVRPLPMALHSVTSNEGAGRGLAANAARGATGCPAGRIAGAEQVGCISGGGRIAGITAGLECDISAGSAGVMACARWPLLRLDLSRVHARSIGGICQVHPAGRHRGAAQAGAARLTCGPLAGPAGGAPVSASAWESLRCHSGERHDRASAGVVYGSNVADQNRPGWPADSVDRGWRKRADSRGGVPSISRRRLPAETSGSRGRRSRAMGEAVLPGAGVPR